MRLPYLSMSGCGPTPKSKNSDGRIPWRAGLGPQVRDPLGLGDNRSEGKEHA